MLELKDITKIFNARTANEKVALSGVSLTLEEGDFLTIIGGNGSGKSTLLNVIAGALPVDGGNIVLGGKDITKRPDFKRAEYISRVFQDPMKGTAAEMTVLENLAVADRRGKSRGLKFGMKKGDDKRYKELVASLGLGLEDRMTQKVSLLSGGQRQALTLLMATMHKPEILLLDEHTAALDPKTAAKVLDLTAKVTEKQTAIMITHNMRDALRFGNKLIMMDEGKIVFSASGEEKKKLTVNDLLKLFADSNGDVMTL
ncbi:MAG: ATP-binding cassette domain-containing protein [Clostridia bacterium]|nr:ATP-binding cassette domain-containing protein [Clostridia bacterium]MBR1675766.1 ATP-binding cassette domain-containing protein [Clostridia bacterium]